MSSPLLINESPLQVLPSLAVKIGLNEAIILQQVHYWLNPRFNKNLFRERYWVRNTYEQWQQQFPFWGEKTIRRAISHLEELNLLISFITCDFKKIKYYTINYDLLNSAYTENSEHPPLKTAVPQPFPPSGHIDQIDASKWADRSGQNDPMDLVNMTISYKEAETTSETTLSPLTPPSPKNEEDKICHHMIDIWNVTIQKRLHPGKDVHLTSNRRQLLSYFLTTFLGDRMTCWEEYCSQIAKLRFLMGDNASGFKVTLEWALNPENAYKVLEGAIYDKPLESKKEQPAKTPPPEESAEKAQACITNLSDPALQKLSRGLVEKLGAATWLSWFKDLRITARSARRLVLSCPSRFMRDYIQNHFSATVLSTAQGIFLTIREIDYGVREPITTESFPVTEFTARSALSERGLPELPSEAPLALPDSAGRSKPHEIRTLSSRPQKKVKGQERSEKPAVVPFSQKRQAHE
jgi:hypothetical protein